MTAATPPPDQQFGEEEEASPQVQRYLRAMIGNGYRLETARDFLHRHNAMTDTVRDSIRLLLQPDGLDSIEERKKASVNFLHYFPLAYVDAELSSEDRMRAMEHAMVVLSEGEVDVRDLDPVQTLRYVLRYLDLWSEGMPLPRQQKFLETLIQRAGDASGDILAKAWKILEKTFAGQEIFLNALRGHIVRTASIPRVRLLAGELGTFSLSDIDLGDAVAEGSADHVINHCPQAEVMHEEALLGQEACVLVYVKGVLVGLLKRDGEQSMLALRNVTSGDRLIMKTGFIYAMSEEDTYSALQEKGEINAKTAKYFTDHLEVEELRELHGDFPKFISVALQRFVDDGSADIDIDRVPEQMAYIASMKDAHRESYMQPSEGANSTQTMIQDVEQAIQKRIATSAEYVRGTAKLVELRRYLRYRQDALFSYQAVLKNRGLLSRLWIRCAKVFGRKDWIPENIEIVEHVIDDILQREIPGQICRQRERLTLLKSNTLVGPLNTLHAAGIFLENLEGEEDEEDEAAVRQPVILEIQKSHGDLAIWITFSSHGAGGALDRTCRLSFPDGGASCQSFIHFLKDANPLLPLGALFQQPSLSLSVEFPFVLRGGVLVPVSNFSKNFKPFLSQDPSLFAFQGDSPDSTESYPSAHHAP